MVDMFLHTVGAAGDAPIAVLVVIALAVAATLAGITGNGRGRK